ncbi:hypothetical protein sync_2758 [Synechococcus sp. CC9311]|nr:hypothetical protein sync_2758 [Synechococcus sp. CC9311]
MSAVHSDSDWPLWNWNNHRDSHALNHKETLLSGVSAAATFRPFRVNSKKHETNHLLDLAVTNRLDHLYNRFRQKRELN